MMSEVCFKIIQGWGKGIDTRLAKLVIVDPGRPDGHLEFILTFFFYFCMHSILSLHNKAFFFTEV